MDDNTMILELHDLFEAWEKYKPNKTKAQIYEELAEMLSIAAEEQGAFENEPNAELSRVALAESA